MGIRPIIVIVRYDRQINVLTRFNGNNMPTNINTVGMELKASIGLS